MKLGEQTKLRYDNLDLLKTIAIFAVVSMHTGVWNVDFISSGSISKIFLYIIRNVIEGVPIFIMINGFLLFSKPLNIQRHMKKTVKIFILTVIWALILTVSKSLIYREALGIKNILHNVIGFNISNKYAGVLWFLLGLITLYIIFPILRLVYDNEKLFNYLFIVVAFFSVGLNLLNLCVSIVGLFVTSETLSSIVPFFGQFNPFTNLILLFYFLLGGVVYRYREKLTVNRNKKVLIILGFASWIASSSIGIILSYLKNEIYPVNYNYSQIFLTFSVMGAYLLSTYYKNNGNILNRIITNISQNTMGIYLIHTIIIALISNWYNIYGAVFIVRVLISILITVISWGLTVVIKKIPFIGNIVKI